MPFFLTIFCTLFFNQFHAFYFTIFCTLFLRKYFVHLFNTKKKCIAPILCLFFTIFCTLFFFEGNSLYTYLILKKCIAPISFLSCCLFFLYNIFYIYLICLQTEYSTFYANSATLISI